MLFDACTSFRSGVFICCFIFSMSVPVSHTPAWYCHACSYALVRSEGAAIGVDCASPPQSGVTVAGTAGPAGVNPPLVYVEAPQVSVLSFYGGGDNGGRLGCIRGNLTLRCLTLEHEECLVRFALEGEAQTAVLGLRGALLEAHVSALHEVRHARSYHGWWHNTVSIFRGNSASNWGDEGRGPAEDFRLHGGVVKGILQALDLGDEVPTTDVFGCRDATQFPIYFCSLSRPSPAVGGGPRISWDCFGRFWGDGGLLWVNSPVAFLGRVVRKLVEEGSRAVMVVPVCPGAWWYQELMVWSCRSVDVPDLGSGGVGGRCPYPETLRLGGEFGRSGSGTRAFLLPGGPGGPLLM